MTKRLSDRDLLRILGSQEVLNRELMSDKLTVKDLRRALELELTIGARLNRLRRIQGRICRLERRASFAELERRAAAIRASGRIASVRVRRSNEEIAQES